MKHLILISASLVMASSAFAQSSLYNFNGARSPKEVRKLGTAPEFPFLRNMTSSRQVYNAIKKHDRDNSAGMDELNGLLEQIGYTNGAKDLKPEDITETHVAPGTEGNMGSRGYTYNYYRIAGDPSEFKAWKIAAQSGASTASNGNDGSLYIFAKCGNAFFPKTAATACVSVPVNITTDQSQITLNNAGSVVTTDNQVYVYYARRRMKKHHDYAMAQIPDKYPSRPILLSATPTADVTPQTYTVTLGAPQNTVSACPDQTLNLAANINVEKSSSYTGNYPGTGDHKEYKRVSKHEYKMVARRMRRIHRKEDKIARRTHMNVDVSTTNEKA
jgi:hypothetical protein